MDKIRKIILSLLVICLSLSLAVSQNPDFDSEEPSGLGREPIQSVPLNQGGTSTIQNSVHNSGGSGGQRITINTVGPEAPTNVEKFYCPNTNNGYPVNGEIGVLVEVRNLKNKGIDGLSICERIDEELDRVSEPVCYLTYFGNKSWIIMNKLKSGKLIDKNDSATSVPVIINDNETISINLKRLGVKGRLIYYYKIKTKKIGSFLTGTVLTFNENEYPDIDKYWEADCKNPIKVLVSPEKVHLYTGLLNSFGGGSTTSISYSIEYQNLSSNNQTVRAKLYKSDEFEISGVQISGKKPLNYHENIKYIEFDLNYGIDKEVSLDINYANDNAYPLPFIYLDDVAYPENTPVITAESYLNSRSGLISIIFLLMLNIVILIYTTRLQAKAQRRALGVFSSHMGDHLDQIANSSNLILIEIRKFRQKCDSNNHEDSDVYYEISDND